MNHWREDRAPTVGVWWRRLRTSSSSECTTYLSALDSLKWKIWMSFHLISKDAYKTANNWEEVVVSLQLNENEKIKITWMLVAERVSIEKRIVGGGNVDDAEASVLDFPLSQGTRRFGNHRRNWERVVKNEERKGGGRFWFRKILNLREAASV